MAVRVQVESEGVISGKPAKMLVYENDRLVTEVIAKIEYKQGADDGYYPCVSLIQKPIKWVRKQKMVKMTTREIRQVQTAEKIVRSLAKNIK